MTDYADSFFDELKPWSRLKNRILGSYMSPYLAQVAKKRERIVLVDAFAGAGRFEDGAPGSPLIICQAAERFAKGKYDSYFYNNKPAHHELLTGILKKAGYTSAYPVLGDAIDRLRQLISSLRDETLFLYIDPYGLNCEFDVLRPLLERDKRFSTEILINLHMPISHRLGSRRAIQSDITNDPRIQSYHHKLTRVFGGEYWKEYLIGGDYADAKERERALINHYCEKLTGTGYLTYTGACPIRERTDSATKYFMVFASPHPNALLLLNDNMCNSFQDHMHTQWAKDTIFADSSWSDWRNPERLRAIAVQYLQEHSGHTRKELWFRIVKDHFMMFTEKEYRKAVQDLCNQNRIECITPVAKGSIRPTKKLNDNCVFKVPAQQSMC